MYVFKVAHDEKMAKNGEMRKIIHKIPRISTRLVVIHLFRLFFEMCLVVCSIPLIDGYLESYLIAFHDSSLCILFAYMVSQNLERYLPFSRANFPFEQFTYRMQMERNRSDSHFSKTIWETTLFLLYTTTVNKIRMLNATQTPKSKQTEKDVRRGDRKKNAQKFNVIHKCIEKANHNQYRANPKTLLSIGNECSGI